MLDDFTYNAGAFRPHFDELDSLVAWEQRVMHMYGRTINVPRLTAMYGRAYEYSGVRHPSRGFPRTIMALMLHAEDIAGVRFNSVLCNKYRDGRDSVSWHSDDDYPGHGVILSASFGQARRFLVRRKGSLDRFEFNLGDGSALIMREGAQERWEHCVPKTRRKVGPRINLTFRFISQLQVPF